MGSPVFRVVLLNTGAPGKDIHMYVQACLKKCNFEKSTLVFNIILDYSDDIDTEDYHNGLYEDNLL